VADVYSNHRLANIVVGKEQQPQENTSHRRPQENFVFSSK